VDNTAKIREDLSSRISRCSLVVNELQNNDAFRCVMEDFQKHKEMIDSNWQFVTDKEKLEEMRITKLAVLSLLNIIETYKADKTRAEAELLKMDNPDDLINKDYDN